MLATESQPCETVDGKVDEKMDAGDKLDADDCFEVIDETEIEIVKPRQISQYDKALEDAICKLQEVTDISEKDLRDITQEIRHLEEKLHLWREVRQRTIERLREIADYIDNIGKKTGVAKVVGSSGGILAGSLTIAGGVMTVMTAGAAAPVLVAGAGIGLASGITGGAATLTKKILSSKQMKEVEVALEVDAAATSELNVEVDRVKEDSRLIKVTSVAMTVGGLASSTKGFVDLVRGSQPGSTITVGLEVIGQVFGEDVNKEITKILLQSGSRVISGAVTSVFGGVTLLWDVYQLRGGVKELAAGGEEGAVQLRGIADQLEEALISIQDGSLPPNLQKSKDENEEEIESESNEKTSASAGPESKPFEQDEPSDGKAPAEPSQGDPLDTDKLVERESEMTVIESSTDVQTSRVASFKTSLKRYTRRRFNSYTYRIIDV